MKYKINRKKTGNKIICYMFAHNMSISELADYLDISITAVYKWSSGKAKPSLDVLANLSFLFNVSMNELVVLEEEK